MTCSYVSDASEAPQRFSVEPEVAQALQEGRPVVALESALITHGLPRPLNLEIARELEETVREEGAIPATIAVLEGRPCVGLSPEQLERLAAEPAPVKISLRDLPAAVARRATGGTTVAATMHLAYRAGLRVFATGGIGGVHRGHPEDVSADLIALASIPMVVVCAGAKAILDLPRTLEMLETLGVPVVGYGTDTFPAFTSPTSGLPLPLRADSPEEVAAMARARDDLGLRAALLVTVPVPQEAAIPWEEAEAEIEAAVAEAEREGIRGPALTPYLLSRLAHQTDGRSLHANRALLLQNARLAARIARAR
ncbi:MAG: pseudouridine-5'-phosphate glycosidase [Anaerolineae bacterium]|nr:pseudouridine-5'-phosphate glycosidase [Anaerolineae bacterium]MCX8067116.1 pseudouridine-5'-phosphate glycosidase [Anaerolineae bacterium]MDW7992362.1 pseudouridine-5'-phosphate glycosidase [Anaerolineae bacterium]